MTKKEMAKLSKVVWLLRGAENDASRITSGNASHQISSVRGQLFIAIDRLQDLIDSLSFDRRIPMN